MSSAASRLDVVDLTPAVRLLARLSRAAEQACQATGISLPQYRLLACVSAGPQRASTLAKQVGVSRPTLTSLVDGLERGDLLRRVPVPSDRRGIELEATSEGLAAVAAADEALARHLQGLVGPERLVGLVELADEIASALDAPRD